MSEKAARAARREVKLKQAARDYLENMSTADLTALLSNKGLVQDPEATRVMLENAYQQGRQDGENRRAEVAQRWRGEKERFKQVLSDTLEDAFAIYAALSRLDHVAGQIEELARSAQPSVLRQRLKDDLSPRFSDRAKRVRDEIVTATGNPDLAEPLLSYAATVENAIMAALAGDGGAALRGLMPLPFEFEPNFGGRLEGMRPAALDLAEMATRIREDSPGATWADIGKVIMRDLLAKPGRTENEQWVVEQLSRYCILDSTGLLIGVSEPEKLASYLRKNQQRARDRKLGVTKTVVVTGNFVERMYNAESRGTLESGSSSETETL